MADFMVRSEPDGRILIAVSQGREFELGQEVQERNGGRRGYITKFFQPAELQGRVDVELMIEGAGVLCNLRDFMPLGEETT